MSKYKTKFGDRVICSAARECIRTKCDHYSPHIYESNNVLAHKCCGIPAWCGAIRDWVWDRRAWEFEEECECDPNYAFKKKKGRL